MQVLIATPTASGTVMAAYARSLINATLALHEAGHTYALGMLDGSDVVMARNRLAAEFLSNPDYTHLLFIDSDMDIGRSTFTRLLAADHPISGAIYPKRQRNESRYADMLSRGASLTQADAASSDFVVRITNPEIKVDQGWCHVAGLGAGCMLIKRALFETLIESDLVVQVRGMSDVDGPIYDFFGCEMEPDGTRLSEDFSFCARATSANFPIWALVDADIGHVGAHDYRARFVDRLALIASKL